MAARHDGIDNLYGSSRQEYRHFAVGVVSSRLGACELWPHHPFVNQSLLWTTVVVSGIVL
jgi:hypothetical protein